MKSGVRTKVIDGGMHNAIMEAIKFALAAAEDMVDGIISTDDESVVFIKKRMPVWRAALALLEDETDQLPS